MRTDGTDLQELIVFKGKDTQGKHDPVVARDAAISPDGTAALTLINHQVWLFQIPRIGGSAVEVEIDKPSIAGKRLTVDGADSFSWSPKGDEILWTIGASLFRLPLVTVEAAIASDAIPPPPTTPPTPPPDTAKQAEALNPTEIALHVEEPRLLPEEAVVLRGANVITMKGDEVLQHADILITGDRIAAIGPEGKVALPVGTKVLSVAGKTIMPGIVDAHAHFTPIRRGLLELQNWPFEANLAYGVTAGRDPQAFTTDIFAYQDLADTGRVLGPRAFSTGPGIFSENDFHSVDDARHNIERYTRYYRTHLLKSYEVGNRQQRQWMVQASTELKAMPTTEGGIDTKLDLSHVTDGFSGNEHNLPQTPIYNDIVQLLARSGTSYTPTLVVAYGGPNATEYFIQHTELHDDGKLRHFTPPIILQMDAERAQWVRDPEYIFPQQAADAAKILRAGGLVALGGHGQMQGIQCHWEMWALAMGGMTPMEVIKIATINGAKAIGLDQDLGSLEPGKLADLVVLDKNPLQDIHNTNSVHWVMRGGIVYEGATLNEVWPKTTTHPESWWQKDAEARSASVK
jgi:imidazolonepropionase-like amidohydrolase